MSLISLFPGVPIFFIISGFLISASYERSTDLLSYCKNRFLRIYPGLWICLLFSLIAVTLAYNPIVRIQHLFFWLAAQLSFAQFYNPEFLRGYGVGVLNGSLWTIPVEIQFYLAVPIIYSTNTWLKRSTQNHLARNTIGKKLSVDALISVIVMTLLVIINQSFLHFQGIYGEVFLVRIFQVSLLPHLYMFYFGIVLQQNKNFVISCLKDRALYCIALYLLAQILAPHLGIAQELKTPILALFLGILTISCGYSYPRNNIQQRSDDVSYGVYLYHMMFVNLFVHFKMVGSWLFLCLVIVASLLAGTFSYKYVEKPALSFKQYSFMKN